VWQTWEGVARELLEAVELDAPVDALELAALCGLTLRARFGPARLDGSTVYVDVRGRPTRVQRDVAHELGHWALRRSGELDSERDADYVAAALLLPRETFRRDLIAASWDLNLVRQRHPHPPWSWLAARATHVADAVATVWDAGYCSARYESPWRDSPRFVPTEDEAALADAVLASGEPVRHGFVGGWPVFERRWRRVVTLSPA